MNSYLEAVADQRSGPSPIQSMRSCTMQELYEVISTNAVSRYDECEDYLPHVDNACHTVVTIKEHQGTVFDNDGAVKQSEQSIAAVMPTYLLFVSSTLRIKWLLYAWWKLVWFAMFDCLRFLLDTLTEVSMYYSINMNAESAILHCRSLVQQCLQQSLSRVRHGQYIQGMSLHDRSKRITGNRLTFFQFWMLDSLLCPSKLLTMSTAFNLCLNESDGKTACSPGYAVENQSQEQFSKYCNLQSSNSETSSTSNLKYWLSIGTYLGSRSRAGSWRS